MEAALAAHLQHGAARAFAWGVCDCTSWVCDWIRLRTGVDPLEPGRGRYTTRIGAARHLRRAGGGGLLEAVRARMAAAGLPETDQPVTGDVGVVETPLGPAMAIRTGRGWAGKAPDGIVVGPRVVLAAWQTP